MPRTIDYNLRQPSDPFSGGISEDQLKEQLRRRLLEKYRRNFARKDEYNPERDASRNESQYALGDSFMDAASKVGSFQGSRVDTSAGNRMSDSLVNAERASAKSYRQGEDDRLKRGDEYNTSLTESYGTQQDSDPNSMESQLFREHLRKSAPEIAEKLGAKFETLTKAQLDRAMPGVSKNLAKGTANQTKRYQLTNLEKDGVPLAFDKLTKELSPASFIDPNLIDYSTTGLPPGVTNNGYDNPPRPSGARPVGSTPDGIISRTSREGQEKEKRLFEEWKRKKELMELESIQGEERASQMRRRDKEADSERTIQMAPNEEYVRGLSKQITGRTGVAASIDAELKGYREALKLGNSDQAIIAGRNMLKILNSTEGADAVGVEEAKRLASFLQFQMFNFTEPGPKFGRDLNAFEKQIAEKSEAIKESVRTLKDQLRQVQTTGRLPDLPSSRGAAAPTNSGPNMTPEENRRLQELEMKYGGGNAEPPIR